MTVDLVVSAYADDLTWIGRLPRGFRGRIYDKSFDGGPNECGWKILPAGFHDCEPLPNVGKCDHTYAHHIAKHYDALADWTVFTPDHPFDHLPPGVKMDDAMTPQMLVGCPWICTHRDWGADGRIVWGTHKDRHGVSWADKYASGKITRAEMSFVEWAKRHVGFDPNRGWTGYHPGGVYGVPRQNITYLPREFYARLRDQLSGSVEPEEGHYAERLWLTVFSGRAKFIP